MSKVLNSVKWSRYTSLSSYFTPLNVILKIELFLILPFLLNCNCREDMNMLVVCNKIWNLKQIIYSKWRTLQLIYSKCNLSLGVKDSQKHKGSELNVIFFPLKIDINHLSFLYKWSDLICTSLILNNTP